MGQGGPPRVDPVLRRDVRGGARGRWRGPGDLLRGPLARWASRRGDSGRDPPGASHRLPRPGARAVIVPGAKLVCTLGPATESGDRVRALAEAGCDVFRVNFSHGNAKDHATRVQVVRSICDDLGSDLAVMADLPGPKIRLGDLVTEPLALSAGSRFVLRPDGRAGDAGGASITYAGLA